MVSFFIILHLSFQVTFHKLLLILKFKYTKYKFHSSGYQAEFSPRPLPVFLLFFLPPRARAYIFLRPDLIFLNSTDSHMANTKQVRYQVW